MSTRNGSVARNRWNLLQKAIMNKSIPESTDNPASKRNFQKYSELINWTVEISKSVIHVEVKVFDHVYHLEVHRESDAFNLDIDGLQGYDKTGRICIWPAEQILSYWCLRNLQLFEGKTIIEIGGGFHCLAALAIAKFAKAKEVVLTDGDPRNVVGATHSLTKNTFSAEKVSASILSWGEFSDTDLEAKFDFVIAADVVYNAVTFWLLIETVSKVLKPGGQFILFNPSRKNKLYEFVKLAQSSERFSDIKQSEEYDSFVTEVRQDLKQTDPTFTTEWHYPYKVTILK